jgi:hypothetical protein
VTNSDWDSGFEAGDPAPGSDSDRLDEASDVYTETTYTSWFGRIKDALGGILFGLLLLIGAVVLLFWNEGRAVTTARSLTEGARIAVDAKADAIDPALERKLIHISGPVSVQGNPRDNDFDVTAPGVRLERKVEMYQWKESTSSKTEKKLGGGEETVTTYSYAKEWAEKHIDSDSFKRPQGHANPAMPVSGKSYPAGKVLLGVYALLPEQTNNLGETTPVPLEAALASRVGAQLSKPARLVDNAVYVGRDPARPQLGDLRISYEAAQVEEASAVAAQRGKGLAAYAAKAGDKIFLLEEGDVSAADMFANAQKENSLLTWILRGFGFLLLFVAFKLIMGVVSVLADVIPFFGGLVDMGLSLVAMLLAGVLGLVVTGIAWIFYRPLLGAGLLLGGIAIAAGLFKKAGTARGGAAAPRPTSAPAPAQR